ncbi:MAG: aldehyde dehydrogenase family protein [Myxococcota bacterium]|nr:aldehyde dehydrogenase family protein [Myxococcota bacterium]
MRIQTTGTREIQAAFEAQKANRWKVAHTTAKQRAEKLKRLRDAIVAQRQGICDALYADFKKPPAETEVTEILVTLSEIKDAISHLPRWMKVRKVSTPVTLFGTSGEIRYEPKGNTLILSPWNYPFQLLMAPLLAAVAAGNCVILKPSEKTPHTSRVLRGIIEQVFSPEEVTLFEGGPEVAQALLDLPFDHIFFTGSTQIGKIVMAAAAKHLATVTLELGGKSPAIVHSSADVKDAAEQLTWGKFVNGGQTCVAPDYVLVHKSQEKALLEALRQRVATSYGETEAARASSPDLCRVVDQAAFQRLSGLIEDARKRGAQVVVGGESNAQERYISPTVLASVPEDAKVMKEEIFGPVLPVLTYETEEELFRRIDAKDKPLALYIFAKDGKAVERMLKNTTAGGSVVNNVLIHLGNPNLPFGGVGPSGQGSYHGEFGFRAFSHERAVVHQGKANFVKLLHPPYSGQRIKRVVAMMRKLAG